MRKIKLIWDFRGTNALKIAEHHDIHIKEYITKEKIDCILTGVEQLNELHCLAFMVINEIDMLPIRDALKPHRGQVYSE